ncbi:MAG TPA: CAP domain-containing protein, partial [Planctomycetota bacterium]|nr:CAP domain-containing protein [Planctomycetota bacterium]
DGKVEDRLEVVEREQLHVTNAYRAMFRHRPLAVNLKLHTSARGHAEEMSKLGYFAHFSPTPGRRTPFDRMKLAGYESGVSENIALNDSAPAAHDAWCHSSGHHRNLLNAQHTEFGIGALGRYWVQNFGQGREYEADPAFKRPR